MNRTRLFSGASFWAVALALAFALAVPADAGVEVGAEAPDFEAEGFINTEPVKLSDLKGRLILLELWKTT